MAVSERNGSTRAGSTRRRRRQGSKWWRELGWRYVVASGFILFGLAPIVYIVMSSINSLDSLSTARLWPESVTLDNYKAFFDGCHLELGLPPFECDTRFPLPVWLWNSVKIATIAASIQIVLSALAAFSFSRLRWRGRRTSLVALLLIQMFPQFLAFVSILLILDTLDEIFGEAVTVPLWVAAAFGIVVAVGSNLYARREHLSHTKGWVRNVNLFAFIAVFAAFVVPDYGVTVFPRIALGTHTGLILVYLGGAIGVNTWLIKGFMDTLPASLDEAAAIDGATDWQIFSRVVFPLTRPILIVIWVLTFVALFNDYILAAVLIQDPQQFTYATGLNLFVEGDYSARWGVLTASAMIGILPILLIFWAMQDRLTSGLGGAVKG